MNQPQSGIEIDLSVEPAASGVADQDGELSVLVRLRVSPPPGATPAPLHLALVPFGPGALNARAVGRALDVLRPGDRLSAGGRTVVVGPQGAAGLEALLDEAWQRPFDTAAAALAHGRDALMEDRRPEFATRLFLLAHSPIVEPMEPLLAAATSLTERHLGIDVFATSPQVDLGLSIRLANLGGGEAVSTDAQPALEEAVRSRVSRLVHQHVLDARLELEFVTGVTPGRMFRVSPSPIFLGNVRLTPTDRRLVLDPGPLTTGAEPVFLLTMTAPKRRLGRYRLVEISARHRGATKLLAPWHGGAIHTVTDDPQEIAWVDAQVVAARDRVEPTGWVEEAARAFMEGDHRRVATTLERLARRFLELGRTNDAQAAIDSRTRYLRTGHLDRNELNKLRRLATG